MSIQTTRYDASGFSPGSGTTYTFTAPSTLLNGSVTVTCQGNAGALNAGQNSGNGGQITGSVPATPGQQFHATVGNGTNGYATGGASGPSPGATIPACNGASGGGSACFGTATNTPLLIAAGGGGAGGSNESMGYAGGLGAAGGDQYYQNGTYYGSSSIGGSAPNAADGRGGNGVNGGAGGTGTNASFNGGNGASASGPAGGAGGTAYSDGNFTGGGGGGGAGHPFGGGGGGGGGTQSLGGAGGGGAGGISYADASVTHISSTAGANAYTYGIITVQATVADPPLVPTLTGPAAGTKLDSEAHGVTFSWTYNPGTDSGSQSAYALRVSTDGGAYQYWNATTQALQPSIVWNTSSIASATVPSGILLDGHTYTWSVATQENHYSLQGPFAVDSSFQAIVTPTVSVLGVSSATGPNITVSYHYAATESAQMQQISVQILSADGLTTYYDSGWVAQTLASNSNGNFTINAVTAGIPTDTGTGSSNPSLHLMAKVSVSPTPPPTSPLVSQAWAQASSSSFDIQWGVPTLSFVLAPPNLISTTQVAVTWLMRDTRSNPQGSYEVKLLSTDGTTVYYDSGQVSTAWAGTIPYTLQNGGSYEIQVVAWNSNGVPTPPISTIFAVGTGAAAFVPSGGPLRRLLAMLAFQLDINRTLLENLRYASDPIRCPGNLLPLLANQLGLHYEESMGMAQTRKLLSDIVHEYKEKGTYNGVAGISTAVTNWGAQVSTGPNLIPSGGYTFYQASGTGFSQPVFANDTTASDATYGTPVQSDTTYTGANAPTAWPAATSFPAYSPVTARGLSYSGTTNTATASFTTLPSGTSPISNGIPIPPGTYEVSAGTWLWVGGYASPPNFQLTVSFYSATGLLLGTFTGGSTVVSNGAWTQIVANGAIVPAGTVWASLTLNSVATVTISGANMLFLPALPALNSGTVAVWWSKSSERPSDLQIVLDADRINLLQNPSFEGASTAYWSAPAATFTTTNTLSYQPPGTANPGTYSAQLTFNPVVYDTFESGSANPWLAQMQVPPWTSVNAYNGSSNGLSHSGSWSMRVLVTTGQPAGMWAQRWQGFSVQSGVTYTVSMWIYTAIAHSFYLTVDDGVSSRFSGPTVAVPANTWTQITATGTLQNNSSTPTININSPTACTGSFAFWVDDVMMVGGTVPGAMTATSSLMPIQAVELYTATAYVRTAATARQPYLSLLIYDYQGNLLETINGPAVTETTTAWQRLITQVDAQPSGGLGAALTGGSTITAIPLSAPTLDTIYKGDQIVVSDYLGDTQTFVCSATTPAGATSIPVNSATVIASGFPQTVSISGQSPNSSWIDTTPQPPLPTNASQAAIQIVWPGCAVGEVHYLDCVMLEQGWKIGNYFDGSIMNGSNHAPDYFWQVPNASPPTGPSFYYRNYSTKITRLNAVLAAIPNPDNTPVGTQSPLSLTGFVPFGRTFTLVIPQTPVP